MACTKKSLSKILQNLWMMLIRQLFEQLTILYYCERGTTNRKQIEITLRDTFRQFTMVKKVKNEILHDLIQFDIEERAALNVIVAKRKWETRLGRKIYVEEVNTNTEEELRMKNSQRKKRILPKELRLLLNLMVAKCPKCERNVRCSKEHMETHHQVLIPPYEELIETVERKTGVAREKKLSRRQTVKHVSNFINIYIDRMNHFLNVQNA